MRQTCRVSTNHCLPQPVFAPVRTYPDGAPNSMGLPAVAHFSLRQNRPETYNASGIAKVMPHPACTKTCIANRESSLDGNTSSPTLTSGRA